MKIFNIILILLATSLSAVVEHSVITKDFNPVEFNKKDLDSDKLVTLKGKKDLPDLFIVEKAEKEQVKTDSVMMEINGYMVQVFKSEDMIDSKNMESMYIEMFGEDQVKLIFEQPFYKIRLGHLRNREEGEEYQEMLERRGISNTILVPDKVNVMMPANTEKNNNPD